VFVFVCEDDFLVEESRPAWRRIFAAHNRTFESAVSEKYVAKEFEEIPSGRIMDDALTPSLFGQNRILFVSNADRLSRGRIEDLTKLQDLPSASIGIVLVTNTRKSADVLSKSFSLVEIDALRPADVARWLMDRYKIAA